MFLFYFEHPLYPRATKMPCKCYNGVLSSQGLQALQTDAPVSQWIWDDSLSAKQNYLWVSSSWGSNAQLNTSTDKRVWHCNCGPSRTNLVLASLFHQHFHSGKDLIYPGKRKKNASHLYEVRFHRTSKFLYNVLKWGWWCVEALTRSDSLWRVGIPRLLCYSYTGLVILVNNSKSCWFLPPRRGSFIHLS